jgi:dolichyl-phosphate-mannose--protein O-mannosyl transferase
MKNITSKTHEEITRLFNVIEWFSLQHIPFDEVKGFWAAKKIGNWNHSQLPMVMMKEQMYLHQCHPA